MPALDAGSHRAAARSIAGSRPAMTASVYRMARETPVLVPRARHRVRLQHEAPIAVGAIDIPVLADFEVHARMAEDDAVAITCNGFAVCFHDFRRLDRHMSTRCGLRRDNSDDTPALTP